MGDLSEKEETTAYAKEKINSLINNGEYHLAILVAYMYASIRLRTLLTDWIQPEKAQSCDDKWKQVSGIFKNLSFSGLVATCDKLGLLKEAEYETLEELRKKRNNIAHESRTWRHGTQPAENEKIKRIRDSLFKFLERTNNSRNGLN
jgi:hypothetical protein